MRILFMILLLIPSVGHSSAQPPATKAAIQPSIVLPPELDRVLREYEKAWQSRDPKALSELFAEDGFVLANGRPPVRGRAAIQAAYAEAGGPLSLRAFAYAFEGNLAYILGGFATKPGADDIGKFVLTLKRNAAGRWQIVSDMDNPNQQRPPAQPVTP